MIFFHTILGMYVMQTVLHSFTALIIIELSFYAWGINDHFSRFRYRLLPLVMPVFMFPLYQTLSPERGTWHFRLSTALFDSQRWIELKFMDTYPVAMAVILILAGFTLVFLFQEIVPIFRGRDSDGGYEESPGARPEIEAILKSVCDILGTAEPGIMVVETDDPVLYTQGYKKYLIVISTGLINKLDNEQLRNALAHEVVHIKRSSNFKTQIIYLIRMIMFYNPVSLVEFRRIVHDDEFICDDITVTVTANPKALISALSAFYYHPEDLQHGIAGAKEEIESHSHNLLLDERIRRLSEDSSDRSTKFIWPQFILTFLTILLIGYRVV